MFYLHTKSILIASQNWSWATDVTWTVLPMFLYVSGSGKISVAYKLSDFIKNILICVPKMNEGLMGFELHEGE